MSDSSDPICFTCEQTVADPPRFNLLDSGDLCPSCRDRVLDALPPLLPGCLEGAGIPGQSEVLAEAQAEAQAQLEFPEDDPPIGA